jgi:uncharacterized protein YbjT (DUF2867 family)
MKVVVIGGSGLIGARLVDRLRDQGHNPVPASPSTGVDAVTGEGLAAALCGAQVVVDVAGPSAGHESGWLEFFRTSSRALVAAEVAADVAHHVAQSVVANDGLPDGGYRRAKAAQEEVIRTGAVPYSILRATPLFECISRIADAAADGSVIRLPHAMVQPVAADDLVTALARLATGAPVNGVVELAGPDLLRLDDLVRRVLPATDDARIVVADPAARYDGAHGGDDSVIPGSVLPGDDAWIGSTSFDDWLRRSSPATARSIPPADDTS